LRSRTILVIHALLQSILILAVVTVEAVTLALYAWQEDCDLVGLADSACARLAVIDYVSVALVIAVLFLAWRLVFKYRKAGR
jgi:uncharacterized membrane protein YidH (DUF202 family)